MKEVLLQELHYGAAEMTPQLRALAALLGNLSQIPSTHRAAHNHLELIPGNLILSSGLCKHQAHKQCTDIKIGKTLIHI